MWRSRWKSRRAGGGGSGDRGGGGGGGGCLRRADERREQIGVERIRVVMLNARFLNRKSDAQRR